MRRRSIGVLATVIVIGACTQSPDRVAVTSTSTIESRITTTTEALDQSLGPVAPPLRHPASDRPVYFVMPDRFANGDPTNDAGGLDGGPLVTGFLPGNRAYHQGGDLAGLTQQLPYLAELGVGAIWITPPFTNRFVQGNGTVEGSSSSYHGYWQIDWDHVDPHLGTEADMIDFIQAAHDLDIHVYFDIVVNHTGDVISYAEGTYVYTSQSAAPYLASNGTPFDPTEVAGSDDFPQLDSEISFPYTPVFADPGDAGAKSPSWLNDVTLYHNRGNSTFQGESSLFGDFFGLDDLFTEHPAVVEGMTDLYADVVRRYGVDGFRVDTMKHVDLAFWEVFAPEIRRAAAEAGRPDFFFFGEVVDEDPIFQSSFTNVGVPAMLDFITASALDAYVAGGQGGDRLAQAFDSDDWFTDIDNNASMQVTFFGNHDMGRMGFLIDRSNPSADEERLLERMKLGFDLLFYIRGIPVVYYGDEQGFVGDGGDQLARQPMFETAVPEYVDDDNIGTDATPAIDNFDRNHPLYAWVSELARVRADHLALRTGAQIVHAVTGPLFAFSRIDRDERIEYLVVTNNSGLEVPARFTALTAGTTFEPVRPDTAEAVTSDSAGEVVVRVPPMSSVVLRAADALAPPDAPPAIAVTRPSGSEIPTYRYRLEAEVGDDRYAEVTFAVSVDGGEPVVVGTDDAPPYRVYWANQDVPDGASVEVIASADDGSGRLRSAVATVTMGVRR